MSKSFKEKLRSMGPAAIITSLFVGPGSITTATLAGANFQYALIWAVAFSVIALIVLMAMASRIGIITQKDVIQASIALFDNKAWKYFIMTVTFLVVLAVAFGFQAGNITGASLGVADIFGFAPKYGALIVGAIALFTTFKGSYKLLEKVMLFFVTSMGLIFIITMLAVGPNIGLILKGLVPSIPDNGLINTIALIGTTLIGSNLVLHSMTSAEKWHQAEDLEMAYFDTNFNIIIGGLITMAIIVTSGTVLYGSGTEVTSPLVYSEQLRPVLGNSATIIGDLGLFAAGLSSAIGTPFVLRIMFARLFKWEGGINSLQAKLFASAVIIFGTTLSSLGISPIQIILTAQALSGFTLPVFAGLLLLVANNKRLMGAYRNNALQNVLGTAAVLVTLFLGCWGIYGLILRLLG